MTLLAEHPTLKADVVESYRAPRRNVCTYMRDGREVYTDTGRPVDERLGTHASLWIVEDPQAWATAIEVDGDAEPDRWPRKSRYIGEQRRQQAYESAAQIRAAGARRNVHAVYHDGASAHAHVAEMRRAHPNPGVRYEVVPITGAGACETCQCPTIQVDGRWVHHTGRYPVECTRPPEREPEPLRVDGEFEIDAGRGTMTCGYCNRTETWAHAVLGYTRLTGLHLLGVEKATNTLVVLAEATNLAGAVVHLPHHCVHIPEDMHSRYAPDTVLARPKDDIDE